MAESSKSTRLAPMAKSNDNPALSHSENRKRKRRSCSPSLTLPALTPLTVLAILFFFVLCSSLTAQDPPKKLRLMLVAGQNNHDWRATYAYLRTIFEDSGRFEITEPATTPPNPNTPDGKRYADNPEQYEIDMAAFRPWFEKVDVIVLNYNGLPWPEKVQQALEKSIEEG